MSEMTVKDDEYEKEDQRIIKDSRLKRDVSIS